MYWCVVLAALCSLSGCESETEVQSFGDDEWLLRGSRLPVSRMHGESPKIYQRDVTCTRSRLDGTRDHSHARVDGGGARATLCLGPGRYMLDFEVTLAQHDVVLRGAGKDETILDFTGQIIGGNGVLITGDRVVVEDLKVLNTPGDGIRATATEDITFRRVAVIWEADESDQSGAYGLYPVGCTGVTIDACEVKGARDAGIYVGQSTKILVKDSEAWGNVAGIEIENSDDAEVVNNYAHDNTAGILVFNLPGLPKPGGERTRPCESG